MKLTLANYKKVYKTKVRDLDSLELMGYEFVENLFTDSSGFGQPDEAAYTTEQMETRLKELLAKYGTLYAFITSYGMFQVNVGLFTKTGKKIAKRLSTNVLEITKPDARIIRLYATDIIKFKDNEIELDNGGYATRTTAKWMNRLLPSYLNVFRKNWENYVYNSATGETTKFENNVAVVKL